MGKRDDPVNSHETLAGLAELEARYARLAPEEPPALLDQAVLNLARREAAAGHGKRRTAYRWIGALSTVSLLVLTLSLVTQQERGTPPYPGAPSRDDPELERSTKSEQQVAPAASPQLLDESSVSPARLESTRAAERSLDQAAPSLRQARPDPGIMQKSAGAVTKAGGQASALPAEPDGVESESTDSDERKVNKEDLSADPEAWLQYILRLQQDGLDAEAADQLQSFREIYPDYPLPDLLQD